MTLTPHVRDAVEADAPEISSLLDELGHPLPVEQVVTQLARIGAFGHLYFVMVAVVDGRVVGVGSGVAFPVLHREHPVGRLTVLVVAQSHAGQGIGTQLLQAIEARLRAHGCARIEVTSAAHRAGAHAFYLGRGYQQQGVRFGRDL